MSGWPAVEIRRRIGMDLGTASTIGVSTDGLILEQPSVVTVGSGAGDSDARILATGERAERLIQYQAGPLEKRYPLQRGIITDAALIQRFVHDLIKRMLPSRTLMRPHISLLIPSNTPAVHRQVLRDTARQAGMGQTTFIEGLLAAGYGMGLNMDDQHGQMIVDVGAGTTDIGVITRGRLLLSHSFPVGGIDLRHSLVDYVRRVYRLRISAGLAEKLLCAIGSAGAGEAGGRYRVHGQSLESGYPRTAVIEARKTAGAIEPVLSALIDCIQCVLEDLPPEIAGDLAERGLFLVGGVADLSGLTQRLRSSLKIPVVVPEDPSLIAARGLRRMLKERRILKPERE